MWYTHFVSAKPLHINRNRKCVEKDPIRELIRSKIKEARLQKSM